ncbi:hypothetical protein VIBNISFn27_750081 [Vibrio nigripulchritudo SFn27]|uniref:Uncharacterized protein n=1 Tax=Vibrio nigripulchritudo TaxID=28173 RepID=U4KE96_9VIBR|nr:hypothetical protein VIBNIBLFn1_550063 [Vibrio nigripulchritudo BLFn1]CCN90715.1 hypothetical protein VIBNISFn27_750081 [Vibrio nigripulchritudo SFn27]CCN97302.1 hypothetical protein VIBNIENn2_920080 [Vibrio nigripulchritudo ENn2]CCO39938.1 hypothetical protein VIBNISFn135_200082 [Vibrio nigripulchritudo SFn135]CCO61451.1 hypothetical protein VIBNI_B1722 [Vibrio nigripulchritudo]
MKKKLFISLCWLFSFSPFASALQTDRFQLNIPTHFGSPKLEESDSKRTWSYFSDLGTLVISELRCDKACPVVSQTDVNMYHVHKNAKDHGSMLIEKNGVVGWLLHSPTYGNRYASEVTFSHKDASITIDFMYKKSSSSLDVHRSLVEFIRLINEIEFL